MVAFTYEMRPRDSKGKAHQLLVLIMRNLQKNFNLPWLNMFYFVVSVFFSSKPMLVGYMKFETRLFFMHVSYSMMMECCGKKSPINGRVSRNLLED